MGWILLWGRVRLVANGGTKKKEKKVETEYREVRLRGKQGFNSLTE